MNKIPTDYRFSEYVYEYREITHSGIACNVNYLDPQYGFGADKMIEAFKQLEQYANTSITAYRAIEWWAAMPIGPIQFIVEGSGESLPQQIIKRVTKPTHYWQMTSEKVEIIE